jgi:hypothetical protein
MRNDGTILNHQKMLLEGNLPVELYEGNTNLSGRITITGFGNIDKITASPKFEK